MQPENVRSAADAKKIVEERKLDHVKVGVFDNDGIMRGKYMGRDKFFSALDKGFGFCDVVLGWDSNDQLYDNVKYTGWHTAYPDAPVRVLPDTCRNVPFEGDMVMFLGEFAEKAEAVCPRGRRFRGERQRLGVGREPVEPLIGPVGEPDDAVARPPAATAVLVDGRARVPPLGQQVGAGAVRVAAHDLVAAALGGPALGPEDVVAVHDELAQPHGARDDGRGRERRRPRSVGRDRHNCAR